MHNRQPAPLYKSAPKPVDISDELKAIFACENRLMKRIRPNGKAMHDWYRERIIFHIEAFNRYAKLCDTKKYRCQLSDMNLGILAEDNYHNIFKFYDKLSPRRRGRYANQLNELISKYLFSQQVFMFTKLSREDQDIVFMQDDSSELFPMFEIPSDLCSSISEPTDAEEDSCIIPAPKPTSAPRAVLFQPPAMSVKERAREYERQRNLEKERDSQRMMPKPKPKPTF